MMPQETLLLMHLSDIHFRHRVSGGIYDLDQDLRNELERDAVELAKRLGAMHGILVTGDIAFAGKPEEYNLAEEWLRQLCNKLGCPPENVWTTPGNHDIDRQVIDNSHLLQTLHKELRPANPDNIDLLIEKFFHRDTEARNLLFRPLEKYNEFAARYGCDIKPERPFWECDLTLNDGSKLRLRGLNSTLVSDALDNDGQYRLVLGSAQSTLMRQDGIEYLVLCHHPPQWLFDQDSVEHMLIERARILLFGHRHRQKLLGIDSKAVQLTAGAVHPDRREPTWQPRYNLLALSVEEGHEGERILQIRLYPRIWGAERCFRADFDSRGSDVRTYSIPLSRWTCPTRCSTTDLGPVSSAQESRADQLQATSHCMEDIEGTQAMNPARRLTYRFLSLPYLKRIEIAQALGLFRDEDKGLHDSELFKRFFARARENQILEQLWDEVEKRHDDKLQKNPFKAKA